MKELNRKNLKKKLGLVLGILFLFSLSFGSSAPFTEGDCDSGDLATTCYLNSTYTVSDGEFINANNLVIQSNGVIENDQGYTFTINLTGNLTIENGGMINGTGADHESAPNTGANIYIISEGLNITENGLIISKGGDLNANTISAYGGNGGIINITSNFFYSLGNIISEGGSNLGPNYYGHGGSAGNIYISADDIYLTNLTGVGGSAQRNRNDNRGGIVGNGSNVHLTAPSINITGTINVNRGPDGRQTDKAEIGYFHINYLNNSNVLDISQANFVVGGPIITPFCDEGDELSTCNITRIHGVKKNEILNFTNLNIINTTIISADVLDALFMINVSNTLNIINSSILSIAPSTPHTNVPSGNITIISSILNQDSNSLVSVSGADIVAFDGNIQLSTYGGQGGIINITSDVSNLLGELNFNGGTYQVIGVTEVMLEVYILIQKILQ